MELLAIGIIVGFAAGFAVGKRFEREQMVQFFTRR